MFKYHDELEIICNVDLLEELKKLNPNVTFESDDIKHYVSVNCDPKSLILPPAFYLTEMNEITNKYNTKSGFYTKLDVLYKFEKGTL